MFVIRYLPFVRQLFGIACIVIGTILLLHLVESYVYQFFNITAFYLWIVVALLATGLLVLRFSTSTVVLLNKEYRVVTVTKSNLFSRSYTQYSFDETARALTLKTEFLIGSMLPRYFIDLDISEQKGVSVTGKSYFDREILMEAVKEGNQYLTAPRSGGDSDEVEEDRSSQASGS